MKKKISLLLLALVFLFAFEVASAEEYLVVDRDEQSTGVEATQLTEDGSWDLFYNKETKKFNVVYNITSEAPNEVTLDLTKVLDILIKYADGTLSDRPEVKKALDENKATASFNVGNVYYSVDLKSMKASLVSEPGDRVAFVVTIKNSSGKTYFYKEDSLVVATPKQTNPDGEVIGFDGQQIDDAYHTSVLYYGYNENLDDKNIINTLVDNALEKYPVEISYQLYVDKDGNLVNVSSPFAIEIGEKVIKIGSNYYYQVGEYYVKVSSSYVNTSKLEIKRRIASNSNMAYNDKGEKAYGTRNATRKDSSKRNDIKNSINLYLNDYYSGSLNAYIIESFNRIKNKNYSSLSEFTEEDYQELLNLLNTTYNVSIGGINYLDSDSIKYDNFYRGLFSLIIDNEENYDQYVAKNRGSWATYDGTRTIGKYMDEKVNNKEGAYKDADSFLKETIGEIKNDESSSFVYGINIDGEGTNNNYMNFKFGYYASLKLYAIPYVVYVNYIDVDGKVIADQVIEYNKYTGDEYKTVAKDIKDYELVRIDGEATGVIQDKDVVVTYVYEFVMGEGGEEFDVVQTGSEIDYSLMSSALVTLSLIGIAIISKKRRNN